MRPCVLFVSLSFCHCNALALSHFPARLSTSVPLWRGFALLPAAFHFAKVESGGRGGSNAHRPGVLHAVTTGALSTRQQELKTNAGARDRLLETVIDSCHEALPRRKLPEVLDSII